MAATATKPKQTAAPTAAGGDVLSTLNNLTMGEYARKEAGRQQLAKMARLAADNQPLDTDALGKALSDAGETPAAFAAEVQGLIRRKASLSELVRLKYIADVEVPATRKEQEAADAEFGPLLEAHRQRIQAIERRRIQLADEVSRGELHRRWNQVFGVSTPKVLTVRTALHKAESELAKAREERNALEAKATSKLYSDETKAEAQAAFEKAKVRVQAARAKVDDFKAQLDAAERELITSGKLQVKYDRPLDPPAPLGGGQLVPASLFGGSPDELVPAPTAPVVPRAG